jgi:hypothetical protein
MNDRRLHQIASALRAAACCATSDWSMLLRLPAVFLDRQRSVILWLLEPCLRARQKSVNSCGSISASMTWWPRIVRLSPSLARS